MPRAGSARSEGWSTPASSPTRCSTSCTSLFGTYEPLTQRSLFLGGGVGFIFLESAGALWSRSRAAAVRDIVLALVAIYGGLHVTLHADRFMDIMNDLTLFDMSMGVLMILAALEAARRTIGLSLPLMAVISLAFYLFGNYVIGGNWQPPRVSADTAAMTLYASTQGLFGMMADIGTRVVAIYVIFGSLLMAIGAGNVFMRAATLVAGRTFGGPAKVAVVTSALFGTISGSAVANVMSVGTITIPTMIRAGYRRDFAAGIEASASAGGQIMPPGDGRRRLHHGRAAQHLLCLGRHRGGDPGHPLFQRHLLQHRLLRARQWPHPDAARRHSARPRRVPVDGCPAGLRTAAAARLDAVLGLHADACRRGGDAR